jgi:hypothetical protein
MSSFLARFLCFLGATGSALATASAAADYAESKDKQYVARCNGELIKTYGLDAEIIALSDPLDPSEIEEEWIINRIIYQKETCICICRRLGCSFERLRKRALRQKKNPQNVIRRRTGRPSNKDLQTPILGVDPQETISWFYQVSFYRGFNVDNYPPSSYYYHAPTTFI